MIVSPQRLLLQEAQRRMHADCQCFLPCSQSKFHTALAVNINHQFSGLTYSTPTFKYESNISQTSLARLTLTYNVHTPPSAGVHTNHTTPCLGRRPRQRTTPPAAIGLCKATNESQPVTRKSSITSIDHKSCIAGRSVIRDSAAWTVG